MVDWYGILRLFDFCHASPLDHLLNEIFNRQNSTGKKYIYFQGRAQEFEREGAQFKAKPAGPDVVKSKKKVITLAAVQYSTQSQVKRKKGQHTLRLFCKRISPLLCAFVCGEREGRFTWIRP